MCCGRHAPSLKNSSQNIPAIEQFIVMFEVLNNKLQTTELYDNLGNEIINIIKIKITSFIIVIIVNF